MSNSRQFVFVSFSIFAPFFLLLLLGPIFPSILLPTVFASPSDHRLRELRVIDRSNVFDQRFLQLALRGQIPGVDARFILDLAYWFHSKSIPCCERLLGQTGYRHLYNCTSLPDPTDHSSTVFLYRMIFECIGEQRNVSDCCWARGIRSQNCLQLCDAGHPAISADAYENGGTSQSSMAFCATQMGIPKERLLWTIFECLNPQFSKVMRLTQMMKAEEERERMLEKIRNGRMA